MTPMKNAQSSMLSLKNIKIDHKTDNFNVQDIKQVLRQQEDIVTEMDTIFRRSFEFVDIEDYKFEEEE